MPIEEAIRLFLEHRRLKRRSSNTIARYYQALMAWQRWRAMQDYPDDITTVTVEELRCYISYLIRDHVPHQGNPRRPATQACGMAPASIAGARCILRALWTFLVDEGALAPAQADYFRGDRVPAPQIEAEDRESWDDATVAALLVACEGRPTEEIARNRAIIALIYESGLRLEELCQLRDEQCGFDDRSARIVGKGRKRRWVFWYDRAAKELECYLALRRGPTGGDVPLFRGTSPQNNGGPMTRDSVRAIIKRLAKRAGYQLPKQAPVHAGRHGFAHAMIDGGASITHVADLLGHADVKTTMRYLHERKEKLQEIHRRAHAARRTPQTCPRHDHQSTG